jgi:hypothetical protein
MDLTERLKKWLVENCDVKADAEDDEFKAAAGTALATGKLDMKTYGELTAEEDEKDVSEFVKGQRQIIAGLGEVATLLKESRTETKEEKKEEKKPDEGEEKPESKEEKPDGTKEGKPDWYKKINGLLIAGNDGGSTINVKGAWTQYDGTKGAPIKFPERTKSGYGHLLAGRTAKDYGRELCGPSDRDKALAGVWAKWQIASLQRGNIPRAGFDALPEHDRELFMYLIDQTDFDKSTDEKAARGRLTPNEQKTLIDDAGSGGLEAAPIVFDDMVIQTPLLHGELFPYVYVMPISRGRRIEGVQTGTVTGNWGGVDATAISLFNTNSYVSAFDTTIFRWEGAIQIGLDFLSDTPIDFGAHITAQYGERMLEDLDDVIAAGNGTTQPEGIINKSGTTSVAFGAATSIGGYESLRFGVAKPEHRDVLNTACFCGTETSYQRMKAIPVGATDARRLFGNSPFGTGSYDDYAMMQRKYAINESLTNAQIFYAILGRYRMYRRKGLAIRTSTEGDTLIRNNSLLIVAMGRYGGQLERGACAAVTTTAPA